MMVQKACTAFGFFIVMRRVKRQIIEIGIFVLLLAAVSSAQDVKVLSQSGQSVTIEVTPDSLGADTVNINGSSYLNLSFRGAVPEFNSNGNYLRQFIPVLVGVFSKQIQVQVLQVDYKTVSLLPPLRSPNIPSSGNLQPVSPFVSFDLPYIQREHFVSRIRVYPFSYDSVAGSYQILSRVVLQVSSIGSGVSSQSVASDPLLSRALVNYPQVKNAVVSTPSRLMKTLASSVLAQGTWYKLAVSHSGIYKLTYSALKTAGVPVDNIQLNTIRIFNNGGTELPEDPNAARPNDLTENAIYVYDANGNNKFDPEDYILFYGKSPREWSYNPATKTFSHYLNHYTESNYYFMTFGGQPGKRMQVIQSVQSSSYYKPNDFTSGIFQEDEVYNLLSSGKDWFGAKLQLPTPNNPGSNNTIYVNKLYGLDSTQNITYRVRVIARSNQYNYFQVFENSTGAMLGTIPVGTVDYSYDQGYYAFPVPPQTFVGSGNLVDQRSALKIVYSSTSPSASGYVDWYEILYKRKFQSNSDVLNFYAPDTNANVYYSVQNFSSSNVRVFDVTNFANAALIQPDSINGGTVSFGIQAVSGARKQFFAVGDSGYLSVDNISAVQNSDLHGLTAGANLIIISPPEFLSQANQLKDFKQSFDGLQTVVVPTTAIYNEFGCGIPDPTAIRDFLKYAYSTYQTTPSYVVLFGGGTYDYKNKVANVPEYVPPYESTESLSQIGTYSTDDYFVQFSAPLTQTPISMAIGRLPARSVNEATTIVNKIIQYESKPDYSDWKNLVTFIGDDGPTSGGGNDYDLHTSQVDDLAQNYTPSELDKRKIYLALYPTTISTEGRRKPEAAADIVNQINQGTLVVDFVGHGAPDLWSYTHIFQNSVTIPQLTNLTRLSLFVAATCDFARDDDPQAQSGAELLTSWAQGGAIGVVSSTRIVFSDLNAYFNQTLFQHLFVRDSQRNPERIGDAVFQTKQSVYSLNDIKYQYIGDPTVRIAMPKYQATIDSLNGKSLVQVTQIRALDKLDIKGTVYHPDMTVWSDLSGTGLLTVFDSDQPVLVPEWGKTYMFPGSIIYRGEVSVQNGRFEAKTVIPTDISYSNNAGKIELYFQANGSDGSGYTRNVIVGGTATGVTNDHIGPQISIYFDSKNFRDGDVVSEKPTLIVDLHSSNGINLSDAAVGHSLQAVFDGQQSVDLAPYYVGNLNSYQDGTVTYPVTTRLGFGEHSVTVRAFDVFNNPSQASVSFDVESSEQLSIQNVYNYPDPFSSSTSFTFQRSAAGGAGAPVNVTIKVFTISGRLIKTIKSYGITDTFVKVDWNGLDEEGDRLANGVYLYKVIVSTVDGAYTSEALGKMAVVR